jgi:hypothetical protein
MIGRLRSAYLDMGRHGSDNPAAGRVVKVFLKTIKMEQLSGGVVPRQARLLFAFKLRTVLARMNKTLGRTALSPGWRFRILRARAMFTLGAKSLKRGAELGTTRTGPILRFPDNSGFLFNYVWGKTLRDGSKHVFGVKRTEDPLLCPVTMIEEYVQGALSLGVDLTLPNCFLFPSWLGVDCASRDALDPKQLQIDLVFWLKRCDIYEGETWHGLRAGGSIELAIQGESLSTVMHQAFWKSPKIAKHYVKAWQVACQSVVGGAPPADLTAESYASMNSMVDFYRAFGPPGRLALKE